jgi:multiple sugar transport system permease protein
MNTISTEAVQSQPAAGIGTGASPMGTERSRLLGNLGAWGLLSLGGIIMLVPFLWMVLMSFKSLDEVYTFPPQVLPDQFLFSNYAEVWDQVPVARFFSNSATVAISATLGVLLTSSLGGYSFARIDYPGRNTIFLLYLSTMMIPFAVIMIPLFVQMRMLGWINSLYALIVPGLFSAWGTFLMRQFMLTIPRELEDAGLIDGASFFQIYYRIILPLTGPALATLGIFTFMDSWNAFLWPLIIISSLEKKTISLGMAAFRGMTAMKTPWHLVMAASVVSVLPIMVLFLVGQKYYVRGIVTTGLKG